MATGMENLVVAVVMLIFVGTLTVVLGLIPLPWVKGHRRRLMNITAVVSEAPSSTMVVRVPFLRRRHILTADPENVQHILKTNFPNYPKGAAFRSTLEDLFGECIVNADGQEWWAQRVFVAREFSSSFLQLYGDTILDSEIGERLLPLLTNTAAAGVVIDLQEVLLRFALDNICRAAFSYDPECLQQSAANSSSSGAGLLRSEFSEAFDNAVFLISNRIKSMLPPNLLWMKKALNIGYERELKKSVEVVKRIIMGTVLAKYHTNNYYTIPASDHHLGVDADASARDATTGNFLSRLPNLTIHGTSTTNHDHDHDHNNVDDVNHHKQHQEFMANMVAGVILAGRDTTSAVLTWFFWLVSTTPRAEASILEEITNLNLNADHKGAYEGAREMPYTHAALCETMRLYPPIPVVVKEVLNDDVLPADGTTVRRGDRVVIVTYAMGRLDRVWGPDWKEFRPERWLSPLTRTDSSAPAWRFVGTDPYRFPVFNAGPRICLGKEMAFLQMKRVVAAVLGRFRVVPALTLSSPHPEPEFVFDLTAKMKGGFPVRLVDRCSKHLPTPSMQP